MNTDGKKHTKKQRSLIRDLFPLIMIMIGLIALNTAIMIGLQALDTGLGEIEVPKLVRMVLCMSVLDLICISQTYRVPCLTIIMCAMCYIVYILMYHFSLMTRLFNFIIGLFGQGGNG